MIQESGEIIASKLKTTNLPSEVKTNHLLRHDITRNFPQFDLWTVSSVTSLFTMSNRRLVWALSQENHMSRPVWTAASIDKFDTFTECQLTANSRMHGWHGFLSILTRDERFIIMFGAGIFIVDTMDMRMKRSKIRYPPGAYMASNLQAVLCAPNWYPLIHGFIRELWSSWQQESELVLRVPSNGVIE